MARKFGQSVWTGTGQENVQKTIYQLGVCGTPGDVILIDNNTITIGPTGIYELDLENLGIAIKKVEAQDIAEQMIVDYVYEDGGVTITEAGGEPI